MTETDVQKLILRDRYARSMVMPNFTPRCWWECDVFELTPAGLFVEFEIKLTRSDFFADAKKREDDVEYVPERGFVTKASTTKHQLLAAADTHGPSRFFFVTALGIVTEPDIPPWAGWIEVEQAADPKDWPKLWLINRLKAPIIHRTKADPSVRAHVENTSYWRYMRLFLERRQSGQV